jgi:hypothetical protein
VFLIIIVLTMRERERGGEGKGRKSRNGGTTRSTCGTRVSALLIPIHAGRFEPIVADPGRFDLFRLVYYATR